MQSLSQIWDDFMQRRLHDHDFIWWWWVSISLISTTTSWKHHGDINNITYKFTSILVKETSLLQSQKIKLDYIHIICFIYFHENCYFCSCSNFYFRWLTQFNTYIKCMWKLWNDYLLHPRVQVHSILQCYVKNNPI